LIRIECPGRGIPNRPPRAVGGGLRHSDDQVELLEQVINLIRRHAPDAAIAFNSKPDTTFEAAARWIGLGE
jgi:hypothetical protein